VACPPAHTGRRSTEKRGHISMLRVGLECTIAVFYFHRYRVINNVYFKLNAVHLYLTITFILYSLAASEEVKNAWSFVFALPLLIKLLGLLC
jgi:hypothetical protein